MNDNISNGVDIGDGVDIGNAMDDKVPWIDKLSSSNLNQIENESYNNHYNTHNAIDKEILFLEGI